MPVRTRCEPGTSPTCARACRRRAASSRRPPVPARTSFDYAIVRAVPRVERDEFVNAGVILHAPTRDFLAARIVLDDDRLRALAPDVDLATLHGALAIFPLVAAGDPRGGPIAALSRSERFHWLVAPRSTIVQTSAVHSGLCDDPGEALERLLRTLVLAR
ncbi:MAG TPA: DUF3037 domain-containing protein [Nannocystaceae bacterium]|nr:DUF3037 domain-containing protein [Nannocystaceae bacterium]